ncbi:MAG: hypothetical protein EP332_07240 [Bacteroidetes bacterium]|nr:MAG: hypothetical protein EP332_07240 [Bacteroidota bacterium]
MNSSDAHIILGLNEGASPEEMEAKFQEVYSDYQIRLSNAPTPNLKKLYQKNLQELEEAYNLLSGGVNTSSDLPSSKPQLEVKKTVAPPPPVQTQQHTTAAKTSMASKSAPANTHAGSKKGVLYGGLIALVGIGVSVLFGLLYFQGQAEQDAVKEKMEAEQQKQAEKLERAELLERIFHEEKFKIKNAGRHSLKVLTIAATFMNDKDELEKAEFYSGEIIEAGKTYDAMIVKGSRTIYDGDVISYALSFEYDGTRYTTGGVYSQDAKDGMLIIKMDR